jgi:predicted TIM-barrel fold metal-dependent hydrolase
MSETQVAMTALRIIDTDTHIIEDRNLWTDRLPAAWGDDVMHIAWDEGTQREYWMLGGAKVRNAWEGAAYGWSILDCSRPPTQADCHPATYDQGERVKVMDEWGIDVAVLYPNAAGFTFEPFVNFDSERALAHIRAYNDWLLEWVKGAPGRFIPMMVMPCWNVEQSVAEIERLAGTGFGGIVTTGAPQEHGLPFLRDAHWDPMWAAADRNGLSVSFHVANGAYQKSPDLDPKRALLESPDIQEARASTAMYLENAKQVTDLLLSGILARYPNLHFASVESGMGWVPFILDNVDQRFKRNLAGEKHPEFGDMLPSDLFRRQVHVNFWFEELNDFHIEKIGLECLLFETDFPHPTGIYNETFQDTLDVALSKQPDNIKQAVLWDNAAKLYKNALEAQGVLVS